MGRDKGYALTPTPLPRKSAVGEGILVVVGVFLVASSCFAAGNSLKPETTPPGAEGALAMKDLTPVYSRPLPVATPTPPAPPKVEAKKEIKDSGMGALTVEKPQEQAVDVQQALGFTEEDKVLGGEKELNPEIARAEEKNKQDKELQEMLAKADSRDVGKLLE